jgi:hypothetical protein
MARKRIINPEAPHDEAVAGLSLAARVVWAYLPCHADREGRLPDKPFRLKLAILPLDAVDMDVVLEEVATSGLIQRYQVGGQRFIQIRTFVKHQEPHVRETPSEIPPPCEEEPKKGEPRSALGEPRSALGAPRSPVSDPVSDPVQTVLKTEQGEQVARGLRVAKKAKPKPEGQRVPDFLGWYRSRWNARYQAVWKPEPGIVPLVRAFVAELDSDDFLGLEADIGRFFADDDKFIAGRCHLLRDFLANANKYRVRGMPGAVSKSIYRTL